MIRKLKFVSAAICCCMACTHNELSPSLTQESGVKIYGADIPEENLVQGKITIHVTKELAAELEAATNAEGCVEIQKTRAGGIGIRSLRRLFPDAGRFEPRTRAEGLHLWYEMTYDPSISCTKAAGEFCGFPGIDGIEFNPEIHIVGDPVPVVFDEPVPTLNAASTSVFDDPMLPKQWHYFNNGSAASSTSGCDINVLPVWKNKVVGSPDVIVSVVDQGVDYAHEDLADNMWHNPEKSGNAVYGYNFCNNSYQITPEFHGTHVAGTIAAVNNNGKGVCGIAGGDSKNRKKGVKLMSCQIFMAEKSGSGASAIKWGADHGAVISQNSWGYTAPMEMPASLKAAVEYFIKYAGIDENGVQTGPIAGGLVIFASGNENVSEPEGTYGGGAINVSSVGADFRRAYYSNYGSWVDISAPGGDARKGNQVLSTFPGNSYGILQGTSMACPHVSGVTALLISRMMGKGVKASEVRKRLLGNVTDIKSFNPNFPMGAGLVNAYMAIYGKGGKAPDVPTILNASVFSNNVTVSVKIPRDADDGTPSAIRVYYSTVKISASSLDTLRYASFYTEDLPVGSSLEGTLTGLNFNTQYYIAAVAQDLAGNRSGVSGNVTVTTGSNYPPVPKPKSSTTVEFKPHETVKIAFEIDNPANHFYDIDFERTDSLGATLDTTVREQPVIVLNGPLLKSAKYDGKLILTDLYGGVSDCPIQFTVLENHKPYIGKEFQDALFSSRNAEPMRFMASDYFKDDDGEELNYKIEIEGEAVNFVYSTGTFIMTPMNYGYSTVTVKGTDVRGETVSQSFRVLVRNASSALDLYPNPVKDYLNVRTSVATTVDIKIISASGSSFFTQSSMPVTPFEPVKVDMTSAPAGVYTVFVNIDSQEYKYTIVKI